MTYPTRYASGGQAIKSFMNHCGLTNDQLAYALIQAGLYPNQSLEQVSAHIRGCMRNDTKKQFFKTSDHITMMNEAQRYDLFFFMCDALGFERPQKKTSSQIIQSTLEHIQEQQREIAEMQQAVIALMEKERQQAPEQPAQVLRFSIPRACGEF